MGANKVGKGKDKNSIEEAIRRAVESLPADSVPAGQTLDFNVTITVEVGNPNVKEFKAEVSA